MKADVSPNHAPRCTAVRVLSKSGFIESSSFGAIPNAACAGSAGGMVGIDGTGCANGRVAGAAKTLRREERSESPGNGGIAIGYCMRARADVASAFRYAESIRHGMSPLLESGNERKTLKFRVRISLTRSGGDLGFQRERHFAVWACDPEQRDRRRLPIGSNLVVRSYYLAFV